MMTTQDFYQIIASIVPLYIFIFIGYGSVKWWKLFNQEQCLGINKFCSMFAVPVLTFYYVIRTNLHEMSLKLFGADVLQKVIVLVVLAYWYKLDPRGSIDWLITVFSFCTLPNILMLGVRFIKSMYRATAAPLIVEIFLAQSVIWHPLLLIMYEYRTARIVISQQFGDTHGRDIDIKTTSSGGYGTASGSSSTEVGAEEVEASNVADVHDREGNLGIHIHPEGRKSSQDETSAEKDRRANEEVPSISTTETIPMTEYQCESNRTILMPSTSVMAKNIMTIVWKKFIANPNTYATLLGLLWAFFLSKFHIAMPLIVASSFTFLSNASLGMGMFNIGLSMGLQPTLIPCGKVIAALTVVLRFIIGPMVMAVASLVVGLRGTIFRIAIVQAAISQGVAPSVFAVEYNVHPEIFSIGMTLGMIGVLPVTLLYYNLLGIQ